MVASEPYAWSRITAIARTEQQIGTGVLIDILRGFVDANVREKTIPAKLDRTDGRNSHG